MLQMLAGEKERNVTVIGSSSEKFKSISTKDFVFKDSINFLNFSLGDLVENLKNKAQKDKDYPKLFPATFSLVKNKYKTETHAKNLKRLKMLIRKQPYPYVRFMKKITNLISLSLSLFIYLSLTYS